MSSRGAILLAIGMLILGLLLGGLTGGVAGFLVGQGTRPVVSQMIPQGNVPPPSQPNPNPLPFGPRGFQPGTSAVNGAIVEEVTADSPAAKAGLQVGDIITAVGGTQIDASHSLADLIQAKKPGDKVDLAVTRGSQSLTITVELGTASQGNTAYLGIRFSPSFPGGNRPRGSNG